MFRTNFNKSELQKYEKAISLYKKETNNDRFSIANNAFDAFGLRLDDNFALHDKKDNDTSLFWKILESVKVSAYEDMYVDLHAKDFIKKTKEGDTFCLFVKNLMIADGVNRFHKSCLDTDTVRNYIEKAKKVLNGFELNKIKYN